MAPIQTPHPEIDFQTLTGFRLDSDTAGRGTLGIIYTCCTAILLALWTSFHNKWNRFLYTFLLPEVAAVWSVRDLLEATWLCGRFLVYQRQLPGWYRFTMKQAFVCIMDGIYMQMPDSDVKEKVSPRDLLWLAYTRQLEYSDYPTRGEIDDKSKSDATMKFISIAQTLFFMVNVIARLVLHYPVSLLEDLAAAHVFCGIITFSFWFMCPHNIEQPFIIRPDPSKKVIPVEDPKVSGKDGALSTVEEITTQQPVGWFQSMKDLVTSTFAATEGTATSVEDASKPQTMNLYCHQNDLDQISKNINSFRGRNVVSFYLLALVSTAAFMEMYSKGDKNEEKSAGRETKEEKAPATEKSPSSQHSKEVQVSSEVTEIIDEATGRKITMRRNEGFGESFSVKESQQSKRPNLEKWAMFLTICASTMLLGAFTMLLNGPGVMGILYKPENDRKRMVSWLLPHVYTGVYVLSRLGLVGVAASSFRKAPAGIYEVPGWTEFWPHV
ncbi:hypothetical protein QBC32DRAFT_399205 [Pseudoneurospora amorphoporcata]|uniref:Uncharacterized protein n=1 Tax=Pseudoneurospora amorphoporcata TaxID=241081 RepID=A0AAN6NS20_9PEZI|nr:hypothetical protein QBC32DRAFT_399205 [Pseudoneurospora amorphoporcata]